MSLWVRSYLVDDVPIFSRRPALKKRPNNLSSRESGRHTEDLEGHPVKRHNGELRGESMGSEIQINIKISK